LPLPKRSRFSPWLCNDTAQATTEIKPKPAVASRGLIPEPRRCLRVSQWLYEDKNMNHNTINRLTQQIVLGFLFVVILKVIQIATAVENYFDAVMVAHGSAPK
jgi:hypothetical protein